jgi:hypothetical protein
MLHERSLADQCKVVLGRVEERSESIREVRSKASATENDDFYLLVRTCHGRSTELCDVTIPTWSNFQTLFKLAVPYSAAYIPPMAKRQGG